MYSNRTEELHEWMRKNGCKVHPALEIPKNFDGVQGVGTKQNLPHKTMILAIPSKLVLTAQQCYNDKNLKSLFDKNEDLFDYQVDEQGEFNVLCVFLMYHKMHIQTSFWRPYILNLQKAETITDWTDRELYGLNKSLIEEIVHVRGQIRDLEVQLCQYLSKTKEFRKLPLDEIKKLFQTSYRSVLTRKFGYYYSTACLIPLADLFNHSCESIDHHLINIEFENGKKQHGTKYQRVKENFNCQILDFQNSGMERQLPPRLKFLVQKDLAQFAQLPNIKRTEIDQRLYKYNQKCIDEGKDIQQLNFLPEDDEQDNDTDEQVEQQQKFNFQNMKKQEEQQMIQFQKNYVKVQAWSNVQKNVIEQFGKNYENEIKNEQTEVSEQINQKKIIFQEAQQTLKKQDQVNQKTQIKDKKSENMRQKTVEGLDKPKNDFRHPYEVDSSDESDMEWQMEKQAFFTISTINPVRKGEQLYNSYGSRTNRFLLVWYGFTYANNYFDSVSLRMQALFSEQKPKAKDIVLDTYIGGQGLFFKKNDKDQVSPNQTSREFRLKRHHICYNLLMYLRLFLMHFYKGKDLYKIFVTLPSSLQYEQYVLSYYQDIIESLFARYPNDVLKNLHTIYNHSQNESEKTKTNFKIIYLQEQVKILKSNKKMVEAALQVIKKLKQQQKFSPLIYKKLDIECVRGLQTYLIELKNNFQYILYEQKQINQ